MGEILDQIVIEAKRLAKALHIEEVKEGEEHHSVPTAPSGHVSQVLKGRVEERGIVPLISVPKTAEERDTIDRIENPMRHVRRR